MKDRIHRFASYLGISRYFCISRKRKNIYSITIMFSLLHLIRQPLLRLCDIRLNILNMK